MKNGYKTINDIGYNHNFILVDNYSEINEIHNLGFPGRVSLKNCKDKYSIGMWKIKNKKS